MFNFLQQVGSGPSTERYSCLKWKPFCNLILVTQNMWGPLIEWHYTVDRIQVSISISYLFTSMRYATKTSLLEMPVITKAEGIPQFIVYHVGPSKAQWSWLWQHPGASKPAL